MPGRSQQIKHLEEIRGSRVVAYVTGDRSPASANIEDDAVRPIFDQLRAIGKVARLDLLIHSRDGALEVPWQIASALRQYAQCWRILVAFRADSAATLLALGTGEIILGRHGEL